MVKLLFIMCLIVIDIVKDFKNITNPKSNTKKTEYTACSGCGSPTYMCGNCGNG